jgi:hypothetical protein
MSPLTSMQVDFESWSKVKLRLKLEKIVKKFVSLIRAIRLLLTIFTVAVGRILTNRQQCIGLHPIMQLPQRSK